MKSKSFYESIYFAEVIILIGKYDEYEKWLKKRNCVIEDNERFLSASSFKMDVKKDGVFNRSYVIWLSDPKDFYSLLHEVQHTVFKILHDRGVKYDPENHESYCYYLDFWFKKLWRFISKI